MENNIKQLVLSGVLGDGNLIQTGAVKFSCVHNEYLEYKASLVSPELVGKTHLRTNNGYSGGNIYSFSILANDYGKIIYKEGIENYLKDLDELGLALWLYDDGSLHKKDHFFNINTHSFSKEFQENHLIPLLNKFNIYPKIMIERKKDGRVFHYLYVPKHRGVYEITRILNKYNVNCYNYKKLLQEEFNRWYSLVEMYIGFKIASKTLTTVIHKEVENFDEYLKSLSINELGFVVTYPKSKVNNESAHLFLK